MLWPRKGRDVCDRLHGGKAPQIEAAAKRRVMAAEAGAELARLGVAIETTPLEVLEAMLYEAAGNVVVLRHLVAALTPDADGIYGLMYHATGDPTGEARPHVLVRMYDDERDRLAALAQACVKLGLDERRVRLAEAQVERLTGAVTKAVASAGLSREQAAAFRRSLAEELRAAT
ncbi:MAG TPA: hypothetical protein VKV25_06390 [Acidimicrobiales bacterium]|nr:hypothetical protein [Acidimicrobiales bacterium]